MAFKYPMLALFAVALSALATVNGKYRISWLTSAKTDAGTGHWVGFELFTADGKKTEWMWPKKSFGRGERGTVEIDEPSIGDIDKVNLHIQKVWGQHHQDDWNGYQVVISDSVTKKTYDIWPGHVDTEAYKKVKATERQCKDNYRNPSKTCKRGPNLCGGAVGGPTNSFNAAKTDFYGCLKICSFCYPADSDEPEDEEAREDTEATDDASGDHEKESTSHKKNNEEKN